MRWSLAGSAMVHAVALGLAVRHATSRRIPRSILARVIEGSRGRFDVCRTVGLPSSAGLAGEVDVTFVIAPGGEVGGVQDTGGTFEDPAVRRCVVHTFGMLRFGPTPNGEPQTVSYAMAWASAG